MTTTPTHADHSPALEAETHDETPTHGRLALTIREAADLCGMSRDAMRGRVERGTLRSVLSHDGMRRIPRSELQRAGLIDHARGHDEPPTVGSVGALHESVGSVGAFVDAMQQLQAANVAAIERAVVAEQRLQISSQSLSSIEESYHAERLRADAERDRADQLQAELQTALDAALKRRRWWGRTKA